MLDGRALPELDVAGYPGCGLLTRSSPVVVCVAIALLLLAVAPAAAAPEGQLTWAVHVTLAPTWFDPAETPSVITPFMILYALHDALVKPMPG